MFKKFSTVVLVHVVAFCVGMGVGHYLWYKQKREEVLQHQQDVIEFREQNSNLFDVGVCDLMIPVFTFNAMAENHGSHVEPVELEDDIADQCADMIQLAKSKAKELADQ